MESSGSMKKHQEKILLRYWQRAVFVYQVLRRIHFLTRLFCSAISISKTQSSTSMDFSGISLHGILPAWYED